MANPDEGFDIQSIMFGGKGIEITYIDPNGFDPDSGIVRIQTEQIPYEVISVELGSFMDAAQDIIDKAAVVRRGAPDTFTARGA